MSKHKRLISCALALAAVFVMQTVSAFAAYTPAAWQQTFIDGQTLIAEGEYAQGEAIIDSLLQNAAQLPADMVAECYITRANARDHQNNFDGALSDYRQALLSTTNEQIRSDAYTCAYEMFWDEQQYELWYKYFSDIEAPGQSNYTREELLSAYQEKHTTTPNISAITSKKQKIAKIKQAYGKIRKDASSNLTESFQLTIDNDDYPNITVQYSIGGTGIQVIESGDNGCNLYLFALNNPIISVEKNGNDALYCTVPEGTYVVYYYYETTADHAGVRDYYLSDDFTPTDLTESGDFCTNYNMYYLTFSYPDTSSGSTSYSGSSGSSSSGTGPNITVGDVIDAVEYADKLSRGVVDVPQTLEYISLLM